MSSPYLHYFLLPVSLLLFTVLSVYALRIKVKGLQTLIFLGCLYPIGKSLQQLVIGPRFVRWYLADIGFVPVFALLAILLFLEGTLSKVSTFKQAIAQAKDWAHTAVIFAILWEFVSMYGNRLAEAKGRTLSVGSARGDYVDCLCFLVSYAVVQVVLNKMEKEHCSKG